MLRFHIYDVFTDTPFTGNPLAIVEGADALADTEMQTLARQFNLSETIFIHTPDDPGHTAKVRIFTPGAEIPFAGHPTIGCAVHLGQGRDHVTLEEVAGLVPVTLSGPAHARMAEFTAPRLPAPIGTPPDIPTLAAATGLPETAFGPHATGAFEGGPAFLFAQLRDLDALAQARPQSGAWDAMLATAGIDDTGRSGVGLYLYAQGGMTDIQARMFAPNDGIPEDPATGSATAILAAQLLANGMLADGDTTLTLAQGVEMGRPSRLRLTTAVAGGTLTEIRVAGQAVKVADGQIRRPG